jgi:hypothetical protein
MENLSVCKACNQEYTYTEYSDWSPKGVLGSALGKIKGLKISGYQKRTVVCSCGTHPDVKITYEHDDGQEAPAGLYTPYIPLQVTHLFKKEEQS